MKQVSILALVVGCFVAAALLAFGQTPATTSADRMAGPAMTRFSRAFDLFGDQEYEFAELRLYKRVASKVSEDYVEPERVDAQKMLRAGLDRVARLVPQVIFEYHPEVGTVRAVIGSQDATIEVGTVETVRDLTRAFERLASFIGPRLQGDAEVDLPEVEYALINGVLGTLDPHSVFIEPDDFKEMQVQNKGRFGGLGITIGIRDRRLTILYPLRDTPAWRAGLKAMDRIAKIGDESTINLPLEEAVEKLRGEVGTQVRITVEREGEAPRDVVLTREEIKVPSVRHAALGDGVGYVKLVHFSETTADDMELALSGLAEKSGGRLDGLVLDLRDNPGGYLQQAVLVADRFIDQGVIVTTVGHGNLKIDEEEAHKFGTDERTRIVVLVDQGSASASEIVSGALKNHDRAVVVGVRTFGKGSVQNLYEMEAATALKLTIAKYLTPGNQSIQSVGIEPDIGLRPSLVDRGSVLMYWQDAQTREKDLDEHFEGDGVDPGGDDPPLSFVYLDEGLFKDDRRRDRDETDEDYQKDFQIQFAKAVVAASRSADRPTMLREARPAIEKLMATQEAVLVEEFRRELGVDWSPGVGTGTPLAEVRLTAGEREDGVLDVGRENTLTLAVRNVGDGPFIRLRAVTESDLIGAREFVFGRVEPGEERSASVELTPGLHLGARADEVKVHFQAEGSAVPTDQVTELRVSDRDRPRFAYTWQVLDDGSGTSRGNGDGLIQPGEAVDVLVSVRNVGRGPTGDDLYRLLEAQEEKGKDGENEPLGGTEAARQAARTGGAAPPEDRKAGFIQLKSLAGSNVFLTRGTAEFSLAPGEVVRERLHLDVRTAAAGEVKMQLTVGDSAFFETFVDELRIPIQPTAGPAATPQPRTWRPRQRAAIRGGASDAAPLVAWLVSGTVEGEARLGDHVRVRLPWGVPGWVRADDLQPAKAPATAELEPAFVRSPPLVALSSRVGGTVRGEPSVVLEGAVSDDVALKDVYVFVNGRKVYYRSLQDRTVAVGAADEYAFRIPVVLEPGENDIEIYARDRDRLIGSTSLGVYHRPVRGQAAAR